MADKSDYNKSSKSYNNFGSGNRSSDQFFDIQKKQKIEDEKDEWFNTEEAAAYLRLTPNALRIRVHRATVKFYKFGSRLRFRKGDLVSLLQIVEE